MIDFRHNIAWIVALAGPSIPSGTVISVGKEMLIGSGEECTLRIQNDSTVSRRHASVFRLKDNLYYVKDLKATNPIRLNNRTLDPGELHKLIDGDELSLGYSVFCFKDLV